VWRVVFIKIIIILCNHFIIITCSGTSVLPITIVPRTLPLIMNTIDRSLIVSSAMDKNVKYSLKVERKINESSTSKALDFNKFVTRKVQMKLYC